MKKYRFAGIAAAALIALAGAAYCPPGLPTFGISAQAASKLGAPARFRAAVSGNTAKLSWSRTEGADAYCVYKYDSGTKSYKTYRTTKNTSLTIKELAAGTYRFKVAALVKSNSGYSAQTRSGIVKVKITDKEENMTERITVNTQSSIRIDCGDKILRIDPFRISGAPHDADIVLITHEHYDHFSPDDLKKVCKSDTIIAAPETMKKALADAGIKDPVLLAPGEKTEVGGIPVETVRAYNMSKSFHPKKNNWLGYIVTVSGNRIYAAGDTDATPEAEAVSCDIALVPIGGTYTMDAKEAAALINKIKPGTAIPIHYGSIVGSKSDGDKFAKLVDKEITVELK